MFIIIIKMKGNWEDNGSKQRKFEKAKAAKRSEIKSIKNQRKKAALIPILTTYR